MTNIIITGASQGIGAATAKAFAKNNSLFLLARDENNLRKVSEECEKLGAKSHYFICDVTKEKEINTVAEHILKKIAAPDILINNAGLWAASHFQSMSSELFRSQIDVNLTSSFLVTKAFLPTMLAKQSGDIFFVCSVASLSAYPNSVAYTAAKHGLLGLARSLRLEVMNKGLRVVSIMPGAVLTPAWNGVDIPEERFIPAEDIAKIMVDIHHLDRRTNVEEVIVRPSLGEIT